MTTSSESSNNDIQANELLKKYIRQCEDLGIAFSMKDFFEECIKEADLCTDLRTDIKRTWIKRCKGVCQSTQFENQVIDDVNWKELKKTFEGAKKKILSNKKRPRNITSQTSKTDSWELTEEAKERFKKDYEEMKYENKWLVRIEGEEKKYLQGLMYDYGFTVVTSSKLNDSDSLYNTVLYLGMTTGAPKLDSQTRGAPILSWHFSNMARPSSVLLCLLLFKFAI
ncbi:hypothetical protein BDC45DRAFT_562500 [Circinella umbellata]|nr:hypothetical protein BDC45DRAFT_562500 [Circinella umbellata]